MLQLICLFLFSVLCVFCLMKFIWKKNEIGGNNQYFKISLLSVLISILSILKLITWYSFELHDFDGVQIAEYLLSMLVSALVLILMMYIWLRHAKSQTGKLKFIKFAVFMLLLLIGDQANKVNRDCEIQFARGFNLTCD